MSTPTTTRRRSKSEAAPPADAMTPPADAMTPPVIDIRQMLVTPQQANQWLANNADDQRNVREAKVEAYARDMADGRWQMTGDSIKITPDGTLIDGQHRLLAIVKADVPVYLTVAFGVPREAMPVIDTGLTRSFADNLRDLGLGNRNSTAAVVRRIYLWERGNRTGKGGENPTHQELLARLYVDIPGFAAATARGVDANRHKVAASGVAGAAFYLFEKISHDEAHVFFDKLITGANLAPKEAILAVRERLIKARRPMTRTDRLDTPEQLALLVRGWNSFRRGKTLEKIPVTPEGGGLTNRNFPIPQ